MEIIYVLWQQQSTIYPEGSFFVFACFKNIHKGFLCPTRMWDSKFLHLIWWQPALQTSNRVQLITWITTNDSSQPT